MPRYNYVAKAQPNKAVQGDIEAESQQDAIAKLTSLGYFPISLSSEDVVTFAEESIFNFWKVSKKDIFLFTRQLSTLVESGVNILNSLNIILNQLSNKYLKGVLSGVVAKVKDGVSLSEALGGYPDIFSGLYTAMVHLGEVGGNIGETLSRLSDFLEKDEEFKNSLRASLTYPFFIFVVSTLTVIVLLTFVIPRLVVMFEDMGQMLPIPTRLLIDISGFLRSYWWVILAAASLCVFTLNRMRQRPQGKIILDRIKLKLFIFADIILKSELGRLARTLSLLLSSGMTIIHSLDISITVVENQIIKLELKKFKDQIAGGSSFSHCLAESKLFPVFVRDIVAVGEETGNLEKSLLRIANDYEREVDRKLKTLTRLVEPVIILVMGLIVSFIVLAMLLPIFQINLIVR
ncbi:MAG: type II secretion system F family protein [Candidatus Omnitrophota bacterium]